ncbi:hypothetical protein PIB30_080637 [Stylosanthes scabra]|uniref:Putative plant transposon protein domain-containing protein n=1 Tax=Stylosanthes scabra TaxID=79078 RepID=A0ABU6WSM8_9FABA|nr:hypothetical protein [Stylosanthes scabra]
MYDPVVPINVLLVREFYSNRDQKNQQEVYIRGRKIPCHYRDIEGVLCIPRLVEKNEYKELGEDYDNDDLDLDWVMRVIGRDGATWPSIPGRISKKLLNKEAWMWMKLVVCNLLPTRHETTLGVDHILLIYALMKAMTISLPGVMATAMNEDPTKSKKQLLPFPCSSPNGPKGMGSLNIRGMRFSMFQKRNNFSLMDCGKRKKIQLRILFYRLCLHWFHLQRLARASTVFEHQQQAVGDPEDEDGSDEDSFKE